MANKHQYVDLIGDATRQKRRRAETNVVVVKSVFDEGEAARSHCAVAAGDSEAVENEVEVLEAQGLDLRRGRLSLRHSGMVR